LFTSLILCACCVSFSGEGIAVITVAKVSSTSYYTDGDGGSGMESYYLDAVTEGEPPGRWMGRGAERLGLSGQVTAEHMEALFEECVNPVTGEQLGRRPPGGPSLRAKTKEALAAEPDATRERQQQIRAEVAAAHRGANLGWD
jgi:TrwC relaxase